MAKPKNLANVCDTLEGTTFGRGGGGKGGGTTSSPTEAPNTLLANSLAKIVEVLSEGEIVGLVNDGQSIYLDGVPLQNPDDSFNFAGVSWAVRYGTPDQQHLPGFERVESEIAVATQATFAAPVVRRITNPLTDRVKVTITIPSLSELDTESGDLNGSAVSIAIDIKSDADDGAAVYVEKVVDYISGKNTSVYPRSYDLYLTGPPPWDIRLRRLTADSGASTLQNDTYFGSYTEIIDEKVAYADTAVAGIRVNAELFGNNIPTRAYEIDGVKIQYPSNYNPVTRVYTGVWDGLFTTGFCKNPAWVFYDLVTNVRYGAGIGADFIDKWGLYAIAQYCDEEVSDGYGGVEPRFQFNGVVTTREEAYKVLQAVASTFRSMIYYSAGGVYISQDRPGPVERVFTDANVIGGFNYSSSARSARHTVAQVQWINPALGYEPDIEVIEDRAQILKYGYRTLELSAYGTTSRGQAYRAGKWAVLTEKLESESVQFKVSYDNADCLPGEIIKIVDRSRTDVNVGGRSMGLTVDTLTADREVTLEAMMTYTIFIQLNDGSVFSSEVVGVTDGVDIEFLDDIDTDLLPDASAHTTWLLVRESTEPRFFRVMKISEEEEGHLYRVFAVAHDPDKSDLVDNSFDFEPDNYDYIPNFSAVPGPSNLDAWFSPERREGKQRLNVTLSWDPVTTHLVRGYLVSYQGAKGNWSLPVETAASTFDINNLKPGLFRFRVQTIMRSGLKGNVSGIEINVDTDTEARTPVTNLQVRGGGTEFTGRELQFEWEAEPLMGLSATSVTDSQDPFFEHFEIEIRSGDDAVVHRTVTTKQPRFTYTYDMNKEDYGGTGSRNVRIFVRVVDFLNRRSLPTVGTLTNPAPVVPTDLYDHISTFGTGNQKKIEFPVNTDEDFIGWRVYYDYVDRYGEATSALGAYLKYEGPGPAIIPIETGKTLQYYRVVAYDAFGDNPTHGEWATSVSSASGASSSALFDGQNSSFYRNASNLNSGTVPIARLGASGTPDSTTFLRGDNTWVTIAGGGIADSDDVDWTGTHTFVDIGVYSNSTTPLGKVKLGRTNTQYVDFSGSASGNVITSVSPAGAGEKDDMYLAVSKDAGATHTRTWRFRASDGSIVSSGNTFWHSGSVIAGPYGTAAAPALSFSGDTDTGLYRSGTNTIGFSAGGTGRFLMNGSHFYSPAATGAPALTNLAGTVSAPAFTFLSDLDTGIYRPTTDQVGIAVGGSAGLVVSNLTTSLPAISTEDRRLVLGTGRSGNGYSYIDFVGDATYTSYGLRVIRDNTGANASSYIQHRGTGALYLQAADAGTIRASIAGTERVRINGANTQTLELFGQINLTTVIGTLRSKLDWGITQSGLTLSNEDNTPLSLRTSGVNRLVINDIGNVDFGTSTMQSTGLIRTRRNGDNIEWGHTNTGGYGSVLGSAAGSGYPFIAFNCMAGTTNNTFKTAGRTGHVLYANATSGMVFQYVSNSSADNQTATDLSSLSTSGVWSAANFSASSDRRIKENIIPFADALKKLRKLKPRSYNIKGETRMQIGFIADEMERPVPELVTTSEKPVNGLKNFKRIDYGNGLALSVGATQELDAEVTDLRKQLAKLQKTVDALLKRAA